MTASDPPFEFAAALEAQEPFLRRLARSLIADEHAAADAVQDTMLSAWKAGSGHSNPVADAEAEGPLGLESGRLRAWLTTVLRRKSVSRLRSASLYHERQETEAQPSNRRQRPLDSGDVAADPASAPDRVAIRLERQALLHDAVQSLSEVYRTALVLRFQDTMSAVEIAGELDLPVATVRSRIQRGLQNLRAELDRHGESSAESDPRASWVAALTPLAFPESKSLALLPSSATAGMTGLIRSFIMNNLIPICLATLGVTGATLLYRANTAESTPTAEKSTASELSVAAEPALTNDLASVPLAHSDRAALGPASQEAVAAKEIPNERTAPLRAPARATISGRAMLVDGTVLSGVEVSARRDPTLGAAPVASTKTDEGGNFTLTFPPDDSMDPVTVLVANQFHVTSGARRENVDPGTAGLEFRIDAIVVRVFPDDDDIEELNASALGPKKTVVVRIEFAKEGTGTTGFHPISYNTSTEKKSCRLLRPGPAYLFTASLGGEFGAEEWMAHVPAGLDAGVYEFPLKKHNPELASYTAHLTGEPLGEGERLWVFLTQIKDAEGRDIDGPGHGTTSFRGSETRVDKDNCLPGTSWVFPNITSRGELSYLYVTNKDLDIELAAGENTEFTLNLARGGRFSVHAVRADGTTPDGPLQGVLTYTYLRGGPPGEIGSCIGIGQVKKNAKKGTWRTTSFVELGETFVCDGAIHPGTIEVELHRIGHESVKGELTIEEGKIAECRLEL